VAHQAVRCMVTQCMWLQERQQHGLSSYEACSNMVYAAVREGVMWPVQL